MNLPLVVAVSIFIVFFNTEQSLSQTLAPDVVRSAVNYHDETNHWPDLSTTLKFEEHRPGHPVRHTTFSLDNTTGSFEINRGGKEKHGVVNDSCYIEIGNVDCERARTLRNYYLYLWGLPMKLLDRGTKIDEIARKTTYENLPAFEVRVPYKSDTWYFYFDRVSYRLLGYKFYQDEEEINGEWIRLEEQILVEGILMPKKRSWYTLPEEKYLGMDILTGYE